MRAYVYVYLYVSACVCFCMCVFVCTCVWVWVWVCVRHKCVRAQSKCGIVVATGSAGGIDRIMFSLPSYQVQVFYCATRSRRDFLSLLLLLVELMLLQLVGP